MQSHLYFKECCRVQYICKISGIFLVNCDILIYIFGIIYYLLTLYNWYAIIYHILSILFGPNVVFLVLFIFRTLYYLHDKLLNKGAKSILFLAFSLWTNRPTSVSENDLFLERFLTKITLIWLILFSMKYDLFLDSFWQK